MYKSLKDKVVLVAGAGGGILSVWCKYLAKVGAVIFANDVGFVQNMERGGDYDLNSSCNEIADKLVREIIQVGGTAVANYENVADFHGAKRCVDHCIKEFGRIDALISGTCISQLSECKDMTYEQWDNVIKNNTYPVFNLTRHVLPHMIERKCGRIIYTQSSAARSFWGSANYAASYGAIYSFMRDVALEVKNDGITVNCVEPIAPGKTGPRPKGEKYLDQRTKAIGLEEPSADIRIKETPKASHSAPFVGYLLTDGAKNITGQSFSVKGGRYAIYGALEEKRYIYVDEANEDWTIEKLEKIMPSTLEQAVVPLWFPRI